MTMTRQADSSLKRDSHRGIYVNKLGTLKINPTWLIYLVIILAGGMMLILPRLELPDPTTSAMEGEKLVFRDAWWASLAFVLPSLAGFLIAMAFWLRGGFVPRAIAVFV